MDITVWLKGGGWQVTTPESLFPLYLASSILVPHLFRWDDLCLKDTIVRSLLKSIWYWRGVQLSKEYEKYPFWQTYTICPHRQGQKHMQKQKQRESFKSSTSHICGVALKMWLANFITYFRMEMPKQALSLVNNITAISSRKQRSKDHCKGSTEFDSEI